MAKLVVLETPYAGNVDRNVRFARACMRDCFTKGEFPFASHLLYTQDGILCDDKPEERKLGFEANFAWGKKSDATVVYLNLGVSPGMKEGIETARREKKPIEYRVLETNIAEFQMGWDAYHQGLDAIMDGIEEEKKQKK